MSDKKKEIKTNRFSNLKGIHKFIPPALGTAAILIGICLISSGMGALGQAIRYVLRGMFSWGAVVIPIAMIIHALCYAEDLANKKLKSRAIFSGVATLLASCIDYAIFNWGINDIKFIPGQNFINMNAGGFIGGTIGYVFSRLIGQSVVAIISFGILALYALFFFADKAGAIGRVALKCSALVKNVIARVKDKAAQKAEEKRQLKEEEAQHKRELTAEQLVDDEFFKAKGENLSIKIKKLGIEENESTRGTSPLFDPKKRIPKEEPTPTPKTIELKRKKADKPIDTNYATEEKSETKPAPKSTKSEIGLDDNADNVFTQSFDPFNFATSEKRAAKFARRVAVASPITEELDEMELAEMKANHVPSARELRMMELERKKREWMNKKQKNQPENASAPVNTPAATVETSAPAQPISKTAPTPVAETKPAPEVNNTPVSTIPTVPNTTVSQPTPLHTPVDTKPTHGGVIYDPATTKTKFNPPVKPVEFVITKAPHTEPEPAKVEEKGTKTVAESANEAEDVAILIAEKIARSTPGYARSANDLKTYTKVVSSEDDELYRQLEGLDMPETHNAPATQVETPIEPAPAYVDRFVQETIDSLLPDTQTEENTPYEEASEVTVNDVIEEKLTEINEKPAEKINQSSPAGSVEFSIGNESSVSAPSAQSTYQRAAEFASTMVNEPAPEFKPYVAPSIPEPPAATAEMEQENTLKVERTMLSPAPNTPVFTNLDETTPEVEFDAVDEPVESEMNFTPEEEIRIEEIEVDSEDEDDDNIFSAADEPSNDNDLESEDEIEDEVGGEDSNDEGESDGVEEYEDDGDDYPIPPEEQNPDVIKMREMFPFLEPIGEQKKHSAPAAEEKAEIVVAAEDEDIPPFDMPDKVESAPISIPQTALVPAEKTKPDKKRNKPNYSDYKFPPLDFLASQEELRDDNIAIETQENADKLIETLASFGVTAFTKGMDRGPRITRYEVVPAKGVKVSSILNLQDDIALNLAAGSIRMEAPIPGKSAVGIEIPNKNSSIVRLRDLLETPDFETAKSKTFVCIGRDVAGQPVFGDLAKMPHLLIAGATGMGKSVCINSLLISILYKARPDEVKLIMIDPKQVEFTMYNGIPHLLVPVVSDPKQAAGALMWAVEEMERRFDMLKPLCVRNIDAYNEKVAEDPSLGDPMTKIIIVIDEFADLMLQVKDPVEALVMRIAQKARAAGIHLVIGTQRPSVNVITGVIKANVPSRISCKVMSNVDSKTVLDSGGAEKLLDKGDALYAPSGSPKPHRVQCAFVADSEVEAIMEYLKQFSDGENYDTSVMEDIERAAQKCSKKGGADRDDADSSEGSGEGYLNDRQFLDAVEIAVNTRKISTSLIQRKMSIGYGKAAKFIDVMEDMGIVGSANGQRPRDVLLTPDEWREKLARASLE